MALSDKDVLFLHQQEQLVGKLRKELAEIDNLLSVGLQALAKGRGEVMAERAEVAQDMVRALLREL